MYLETQDLQAQTPIIIERTLAVPVDQLMVQQDPPVDPAMETVVPDLLTQEVVDHTVDHLILAVEVHTGHALPLPDLAIEVL
jgi:hypothetical protein